jgi:uncharacterized protein DUF5931
MSAPGADTAMVPLWRGLAVFRVVALAYAVANVVRDAGVYARPALGVAVVVFMAHHVQNVLRKLQLTNRVELARYAFEQGLDEGT